MPWIVSGKSDRGGCALADRHYSRRKVGSLQFMPPGQTLVLVTVARDAVFGWWRPHPRSGLVAMNGLDGWTCSIFHNESPHLSSALILEAEGRLLDRYDCGPDGLLSYIWTAKVRSLNPGYCFKRAGYARVGVSADRQKILLQKPALHGAVRLPDLRLFEQTRRAS